MTSSRFATMTVMALVWLAVGGAGCRSGKLTRQTSGGRQESLLELIPARARAAIVMRKNALGMRDKLFAGDPDLDREVSTFLTDSLGVDLTRASGIAAFATSLDLERAPTAAVVFRLAQPPTALTLPASGNADGVTLHRLGEGMVAAVLKRGVVLGEESEVRAAIAVDQGREPPSTTAAGLGKLLGADVDEVDFAVAVTGEVPAVRKLGVDEALLAIRHAGQISLHAQGDHNQLLALQGIVQGGLQTAVNEMDRERANAKASKSPIEGVGAIVAYHQVLKLKRELQPKVEGSELTMTYELPSPDDTTASMTMMAPAVIGVLAAVAIPAFMKYTRRSKTVEATMNIRKLYDSAVVYYESEHADANGLLLPRQFPPSTDWTPAESPCKYPGQKYPVRADIWHLPTWEALNFAIDDPSYYSYKFESSGTGEGASFTASARGDLDCDGVYSLFQRVGFIQNGNVTGGAGLYTMNEIE